MDFNSVDHKMLDELFEAFSLIGRGEYVSLYDVKRKISRYSPAAADLFGLTEYVKNGVEDWGNYIHPEDRKRYEKLMESLLEGNALGYDVSYRVLLKDGSYVVTRNIGAVIRNESGEPAFVGGIMINEGLTENTDPITVLRNQYGFFQDLKAVIELRKDCVLLLIGISKMNTINEIHGYGYGNRVLQNFAWFLQEAFGQDGVVYRIDGVKFAFLTETLSTKEVTEKYEKVRRTALGGISVDNVRQVLVLSCGMFSYDGSTVDERSIYACLNRAYRDSKISKTGKLVNYDGIFGMTTAQSLEMIDELRNCIIMDCEGFNLRYQPIVFAEGEKIAAVEALLSWQSERFGEVPPDEYVPVLERDFLFEELGYWIFRQAMTDGLRLLEKNPDLLINVNISPAQIQDEFLIDELVKIAGHLKFPLKNLCIELTANCRQLDPEILKSAVVAMREREIRCLIDDFGNGFASIDFLQILSPDYVKPDRRYVFEIVGDAKSRKVIRHITELASDLGAQVYIKGVANAEIRDMIKKFPVQCLQGHFYSEPIGIENLIEKYFA